MSDWADEHKSNLKERYQKNIRDGKSKPDKYTKMKSMGFNNFKPFGEKIQKFSKKPITLIYGPNSIGKSSFIHMAAYMRYINETKNLDLKNTDMFGDNINLGGFDKFIHKRDKNNKLTLEYEFEDCSEAILDYLNIEKIPTNILKALATFSTSDIVDIIKNSESYVSNIFKTTIDVSFGKPIELSENEIKNFKAKRRSNEICSYVNINELNFLINFDTTSYEGKLIDQYYKFVPYVCSDEYKEDIFENKSDYVNINLDNDSAGIDLNDMETRNIFISDTLIPFFINEAKLQYLLKNYKYHHINKPKELLDDEITKIAKITISFISQLIEEEKFLNSLKESPISLKIIVEIKYIKKFNGLDFIVSNEVNIENVNYFINNQLFDKLTYKDKINGNGLCIYGQRNSIGTMEFHSDNYEAIIPKIFKNIPDSIKDKLYLDNERKYFGVVDFVNPINKFHEQNNSILFLSFKNGYNDLIGAFNDMIGFNKMQYIGPLRFYPERDASFTELDDDISILPDSQTSWSYLKKDKKLRDTINKWLRNPNKLKTPYEIKYRKLYALESSLEKLDIDKLIEIKQIVQNKIDTIKEYSITNTMIEEKQDELVLYLAKKNVFKNRGFEFNVNEQRKIVNDLILFSELSNKQKYQKTLVDENILGDIDSKEELVFEDLRNGTQISNRDLGLGISQILPILIATNHQKNMTIAIEQPELHLHPAVQCEIADELIRSYKQNKNEFLIETHSEHLLLRIMKRMRWKSEEREDRDTTLDLTPDDVCLLYIDTNGEQTYINELELDEDGSLLDPWPNGFFEEGSKERFD